MMDDNVGWIIKFHWEHNTMLIHKLNLYYQFAFHVHSMLTLNPFCVWYFGWC